jgi:hypothetical protein
VVIAGRRPRRRDREGRRGLHLRRAIDIHEGEKINEKALKALIKAAAKLNAES